MNEIIAIIALAGYGMILRDLSAWYLAKRHPQPIEPTIKPMPYPLPPVKRRSGPWS